MPAVDPRSSPSVDGRVDDKVPFSFTTVPTIPSSVIDRINHRSTRSVLLPPHPGSLRDPSAAQAPSRVGGQSRHRSRARSWNWAELRNRILLSATVDSYDSSPFSLDSARKSSPSVRTFRGFWRPSKLVVGGAWKGAELTTPLQFHDRQMSRKLDYMKRRVNKMMVRNALMGR